MDRHVERFHAVPDGDLMLCPGNGVAYQRDMSQRVSYDKDYFDKYVGYEGTPIARRIVSARVAMVRRHYPGALLDVGVGSGEFLRACGTGSVGFDINPVAVAMLQASGRYQDRFDAVEALTFWDTLEHVEDPDFYFSRIRRGAYVFVSLPIFSDLRKVRESKHYRPGEHFYYWTARGFVDWMARHGFRLIEQNREETEAGREAIESFAFVKDLWRMAEAA